MTPIWLPIDRDAAALKKGTAELLVLAQLEDAARHGYEIAQQIAARGGRRRLVPRRLALSRPLPARAARPHRRPLGGEGRASAVAATTG